MVNLLAVKHRTVMQAVMLSWAGAVRLDARQLGLLFNGGDHGLQVDDRQFVARLDAWQLSLRDRIAHGECVNGATIRIDQRDCLRGWVDCNDVEVAYILSLRRADRPLRM